MNVTNVSTGDELKMKELFFSKGKISFVVYPRYTPGSPGLVTERIALHVAEDEKNSYPYCLEGISGEQDKKRAEILGLDGIAIAYKEQRKFFVSWDLITNVQTRRPSDKQQYRKLGYLHWSELQHDAKAIESINVTGFVKDWDHYYYKQNIRTGLYERFKPEVIESP